MQVRPGQVAPSVRLMSGGSLESDAEFDARFRTIGVVSAALFTLSGTLPISTEQTLMAGRLGRLVLQTNLKKLSAKNILPFEKSHVRTCSALV